MKAVLRIAVIGSLFVSENDDLYQRAYNIGNFLSKEGFSIISLKESTGVLRAAYLGAMLANGSLPSEIDPVSTDTVTDKSMINLQSIYYSADLFVILPGGAEVLLYLSYILNQSKILGEEKRFIVFGEEMRSLIETLKENSVLEEFEISRINYASDLQSLKRTIVRQV